MPLFYASIRTADTYVDDLEGQEFDDLEAAKADAEATLLEMTGEKVKAQSPVDICSIEIRCTTAGSCNPIPLGCLAEGHIASGP